MSTCNVQLQIFCAITHFLRTWIAPVVDDTRHNSDSGFDLRLSRKFCNFDTGEVVSIFKSGDTKISTITDRYHYAHTCLKYLKSSVRTTKRLFYQKQIVESFISNMVFAITIPQPWPLQTCMKTFSKISVKNLCILCSFLRSKTSL